MGPSSSLSDVHDCHGPTQRGTSLWSERPTAADRFVQRAHRQAPEWRIIPASRSSANSGALRTPSGRCITLIDLPGTYSLRARSPDEEITRDVVLGRLKSETAPDSSSASPTPPICAWR